MANHQGIEYFMIVPAGGRGWREAREKALDRIEAAIDAGKEPGEDSMKSKKPMMSEKKMMGSTMPKMSEMMPGKMKGKGTVKKAKKK